MRVALTAAPPETGLQLVEWLPGEKVRFRAAVEAPGQRRENIALVPDAGLAVRVQGRALKQGQPSQSQRHYAFVEVDRGTEASRILAAKCRAYLAYWREGGFARDFGLPREMGFWVLLVAPTPRRAQTILAAIAAVDGPQGRLRLMFRVALSEAMQPSSIGEAVWRDGASGQLCRFYEVPA